METENKILNEKLFEKEYPCGLRAYVMPKKGYQKKYATFATNYGSVDSKFILENGEIMEIPDGVAHFLEHKLFSQKDGNAMDKFTEEGASSNAYTSFTHTAYLFSCTENFNKNFELLLNFVQNPYITEESVENEKGIIGQEIRMYQDDPDWQVYFNFINNLYHNCSVKKDIAGTSETISGINTDILYKCFNTFYHPSNMVIFVVGDVNPDEIFGMIEKNVDVNCKKVEIKRIYEKEPEAINKEFNEKKCDVSLPMFIFGFKLNPPDDEERLKKEIAIYTALEMLMGKSTELYEKLYEDGLLTAPLSFDTTFEKEYAFFSVSGESNNPEEVIKRIKDAVNKSKNEEIDKDTFERIRKRLIGEFIRQFNSVDKIAHLFISDIFRNIDIFDYTKIYSNLNENDIKEVINSDFLFERSSISVAKA